MKPDTDPADERLQKFDNHAEHLLGAIRLCLQHKYIVPAMMLIFAGIDGMAWLYREHEGRNNREDFQHWVEQFMIVHHTSGTVCSTDFWAARCALLHEQSSNSELTRAGRARPFLYRDSDGQGAFPLTAQFRVEPLVLTTEGVFVAFEKAIGRFRGFIETSERRESILARCVEWFDYGVTAAGVASEV